MEYKILSLSELMPYSIRDIRDITLSQLKESINKRGYNKSHLLSVIKNSEGGYFVIDGNHRLRILQELDIHEIPCVIYSSDIDPYKLAIDCNIAEDTYAPMDLFDWLDIINSLKKAKLTQKEIGERIGWSREQVSRYIMVIDNVAPEVLNLARSHQEGRGAKNAPNGAFPFTEGWFRNSGIYELKTLDFMEEDKLLISYPFQEWFIKWFIKDKECKVANKLIKKMIASYLERQEQIPLIYTDLSKEIENYEEIKDNLEKSILKGEYTTKRLIEVIEKYNEGAKNKAIFGVDCIEELKKIKSGSIDCIITDPPWGVDFKPSRKTDNPSFDTNIEENLIFLDNVFSELRRVSKDNAHIYIFFPTKYICEFKKLLNKYFILESIPLIWVKNNHNPCDYQTRYASQYETIFFCKNIKSDERKLNYGVSPDILQYNKPIDKYHDCQKPLDLLQFLIKNSSGIGETILDPFAGSGSTLLAAKSMKRYYIGFEIEEEYKHRFNRELSNISKEND